MNAAVKYGLIGSAVALLVLITQYFIVDEETASHTAFKYLVQLTLFVSIIASIKITKDKEIPGGAIDLKSGLRAGAVTTLLIVVFVSFFFFFFYKTLSPEKFLSMSDKQFTEYFAVNPVKDTTEKHFNQLISSADSSVAKTNYGYAKMSLEVAKQIRKDDAALMQKLKELNPKIAEQYSSTSFVMSQIFPTMVGQLLMGVLIAFFTTMVFRYKQ